MIFNAFDVDKDDETADTIAFENGQQAVIVYDKDLRVKCAWVIADKDDDIVIPDNDTGNSHKNNKTTEITGVKFNSANFGAPDYWYTTVASSVKNAEKVSLKQIMNGATGTTSYTLSGNAGWNYGVEVYRNVDTASAAAAGSNPTAMGTATSGLELSVGQVIVVSFGTNGNPGGFLAYEIVE